MSKIFIILGVALLIAYFIGVVIFLILLRKDFCKHDCPYRHFCKFHEKDKGFVPPCYKHIMSNLYQAEKFGI